MPERDRHPGRDEPDAVRVPAPDVALDSHLHHSDAEREALVKPAWWPVRLSEIAGALVVLALVVGVTAGVVLRASGNGVLGLVELAGISVLVMVVLGTSSLAYRDEHVRLELLDVVAGQKVARALDVFVDVVQLAVVAVVAYALQDLFRSDLSTGTTTGGELGLARSWVSGTATVGFVLVALVMVRKLTRDLIGQWRGR
jgi:TRAP-type C4-dicarboxylate transport system permease small subunit